MLVRQGIASALYGQGMDKALDSLSVEEKPEALHADFWNRESSGDVEDMEASDDKIKERLDHRDPVFVS
ncbi:hypothetical protein MMC09_006430 [Bachmanniomyces sp. S44760]|nr:hypothetical protein [Bachmanniomyces sp. S44760]